MYVDVRGRRSQRRAFPQVRRPEFCEPSPRPLRTGSIAARGSRRSTPVCSGRPVLSGRAPLRPVPERFEGTNGVSGRPVLSGRAPLRLSSELRTGCRRTGSPRPLRTGSIAAPQPRRDGSQSCWRPQSRPVLSGRAPLRLLVPDDVGDADLSVAPSSPDGLHCGVTGRASVPTHTQVAPSSPDGLHCGSTPGRNSQSLATSRPVLSGRAPLRHQVA